MIKKRKIYEISYILKWWYKIKTYKDDKNFEKYASHTW